MNDARLNITCPRCGKYKYTVLTTHATPGEIEAANNQICLKCREEEKAFNEQKRRASWRFDE